MSDEAKSLTFTLADHDLLVKCTAGVESILLKMHAIELRQDLAEKRLKAVEDWKIKVMAIVLCIGILFGYSLRIFDFVSRILTPVQSPLVTPAPQPVIPEPQSVPKKAPNNLR